MTTTMNDVTKALEEAERHEPAEPAPRKSAVEQLLGDLAPIAMAGFDAPGPISYEERLAVKASTFKALQGLGLERLLQALAGDLMQQGFWADVKSDRHVLQLQFVPERGTEPVWRDEEGGRRCNVATFALKVIASNVAGQAQVELDGKQRLVVPAATVTQALVRAGFQDFVPWAIKAHKASQGKRP